MRDKFYAYKYDDSFILFYNALANASMDDVEALDCSETTLSSKRYKLYPALN